VGPGGGEKNRRAQRTSARRNASVCADGKLSPPRQRREGQNLEHPAGDLQTTLDGHTQLVKCVLYSPRGKYLASGSVDSTVRIYDAHIAPTC